MRKTIGFIVTWQGQPMRDASPTTVQRAEIGRLFVTGGKSATTYPTRAEAVKAMRRSIRAWGRVGTPINDAQQWAVARLVTPWKPKR